VLDSSSQRLSESKRERHSVRPTNSHAMPVRVCVVLWRCDLDSLTHPHKDTHNAARAVQLIVCVLWVGHKEMLCASAIPLTFPFPGGAHSISLSSKFLVRDYDKWTGLWPATEWFLWNSFVESRTIIKIYIILGNWPDISISLFFSPSPHHRWRTALGKGKEEREWDEDQ